MTFETVKGSMKLDGSGRARVTYILQSEFARRDARLVKRNRIKIKGSWCE